MQPSPPSHNLSTPTPPAAGRRTSSAPLRRLLILATTVSLAAADGWMASFTRQSGGEWASRWSGAVLLWGGIGAGSSLFFWRKIWPPPHYPQTSRPGVIAGSVALLLPCLWWLTFPLRFISGQNFRDVTAGLAAAAAVLAFGAWMVVKLIRAFESSDAADLADAGYKTTPPASQDHPEDSDSRQS